MRRNIGVAGALFALAAGCSSRQQAASVDAGGMGLDSGAERTDAVAERMDASGERMDAVAERIDAVAPPMDGGAQPTDAGAPPVDAVAPPIDAGAPPVDAGPLSLDGGASIQALPYSTNDLVFDPTRHVLHATMNPTAAGTGNSVLTINPATATVTGSLFVGSNPNALALSDDGSALYVGIDGADSVRRVDLGTSTVGPLVSLGSNDISARTAGQIAAVPGSSTQYVVSRLQPGISSDFAGLALYDGSTLLAEWEFDMGADSITFTDSSTLFGCCTNDVYPTDLIRFSVTPLTITIGKDAPGLITDFGKTQLVSNGGWIFANNGQAVDATTMAVVGTYADSGAKVLPGGAVVSSSLTVLADADGANVWFLRTADPASAALVDFDRTTFLLRRSISLASLPDANLATASALVRWSPTGLAFRTSSAVYLMIVPN